METEGWRRPGFTIPGYAAAAARKGHQMQACRQWTPEEARAYARRAAEKRWQDHRRQHQEHAHA
jgi:hypothetical protein